MHKFSPRAIKCVFLGYPSGYKGYKVLDLNTNKVLISRDIVFHDNIFHFAIKHPAPAPFPLHVPAFSYSLPPSPTLVFPFPVPHNNYSSTSTSPFPITQPATPIISYLTTRSGRIVKPSSFLNDYICTSVHSNYQYPLHYFINHSNLSPSYSSFIASITAVPEPATYEHASAYSEWRAAMDVELSALQANGTWSLVPLPPGKTTI